jgi:8-oxo-dGTP diphosphatase
MKLENAKIAIDPVIFSIYDNNLYVYTQKRAQDPFKGALELPGGVLLTSETAEETLQRKLQGLFNETGFLKQFHTFTNPDRDPRGRVISIGFFALVPYAQKDTWIEVSKLPKLAFDHNIIIETAKKHLKEHCNPETLQKYMPEKFPLNTLQKTYEVILETKLDNRNFRKQMIASGDVIETNELETNVSHRPAKLFTFKKS